MVHIIRYTAKEYADLLDCTKEELAEWYGEDVVAFFSAQYGNEESAFLGMQKTDGSYSVCGLRRDQDNITYDNMVEVLESGF